MDEIESIHWGHPLFFITAFVLGCCVGSYLNAVIYRLPRGLSTSDPKRSFCPICKKSIPFFRNIPIFTWLIQRGKCAECDAPIAVRYLLVELLTGLVWTACWWFFAVHGSGGSLAQGAPLWYPGSLACFFIVMSTIAIVITFIDIEHLIIPIQLSIGGAVVAIIGSVLLPWYWGAETALEGLKAALIGGAAGYLGLWGVVLLGKLLFGRQKIALEKAMDWHLREAKEDSDDPNENLSLVLGEDDNFWHDLFYRDSDKLYMKGVSELEVNNEAFKVSEVVMTQEKFIVGTREFSLEEVESMSGKVESLVIPREAMGMGDVHLLGVIGLCLGVKSLLLVILASCLIGIVIHILARAGLGKRLPFGPSLILGAAVWIVCGPQLVEWYMGFIHEAVHGEALPLGLSLFTK